MLNFKTYLKEENSKYEVPIRMVLELEFGEGFDTIDISRHKKGVKQNLEHKINSKVNYIQFANHDWMPSSCFINFDLLPGHYTENDLEKASEKLSFAFEDVCQKFNPTIASTNIREVIINGPLKSGYSLETHLAIFIAPQQYMTFHDISKQLNVKTIHFRCISVTKYESLLGLLKIKKLQKITMSKVYKPEWFDIIVKHVKDKDILLCHEELVDNGLENLAEL